jgi:hypothetical protein
MLLPRRVGGVIRTGSFGRFLTDFIGLQVALEAILVMSKS